MKKSVKAILKKYLWFAVGLVVVTLIWIFIVPHPERELAKRFEKERNELKIENQRYEQRIKQLQKDSIETRLEMAKRSKDFAEFERKSNQEYERLKRSKVKLNNSTQHSLDSIRLLLFPRE